MTPPTKEQKAFLSMLASGSSFEAAATSLGGDDVGRVPFACILNGWVDGGRLTAAGRAIALKAMQPEPWIITVLNDGAKR